MKKYSNFFIVIFSSIMLFLVLMRKELVSSSIISSLSIWLNTLVPSMFPMFILSDILINYNFTYYIPKKIVSFFSKLFNVRPSLILVLFLSIISGFPSNARNIKLAYDQNMLSKKEAEHLLLFNHFANPLFVLGTIGTFFLNNNLYGIIILISHILSNFIIGIIFRKKCITTSTYSTTCESNCQSFGNVLSSSIKKSIDSLFMVAGTVTLFLILSTLIINIFSFNNVFSFLIQAILEMTMGLSSLAKLNISDIYKVVLSTMIISFGGLSVHLQVISMLDNTDIKYSNYLKGRIYQMFISGIISYLIMSFI